MRRIDLVIENRHAQRCHLHAQLMLLPREWSQPITGERPLGLPVHFHFHFRFHFHFHFRFRFHFRFHLHFQQLDARFGVRLTVLLAHAHEVIRLHQPAAIEHRQWQVGAPGRDCLVALFDRPVTEERLILAARIGLSREQHHTRRFAVDAVHRREGIDLQFSLQTHQQGFLKIAATGGHRQKVRLIHRDEVVILKQHDFLERNSCLGRDAAVVVKLEMRLIGMFGRDGRATGIQHVATQHARFNFTAGNRLETLREKVNHLRPQAGRKHQATGADTVSGRQDCANLNPQALLPGLAATRHPAHRHRRPRPSYRFPAASYPAQRDCRIQSTRLPSHVRRRASARNN